MAGNPAEGRGGAIRIAGEASLSPTPAPRHGKCFGSILDQQGGQSMGAQWDFWWIFILLIVIFIPLLLLFCLVPINTQSA
ncbi:MAG: hypothetical protein H5U02_10590 [Clostridia bacterium]|nr:hypothetical protein [Clostridia bacterium]